MPKTFTIGTYDKKHKENLAKRARKVQQLYDAAIKRIAQAAAPSLFDADPKKEFHFEDFPAMKKEMEALMQDLGSSLQANIEDGDQESWTLSNTKNDAMVDSIIGKKKLPAKTVKAWKHPHLEALNAFIARKEAGMNLSRRVWNLTQQFKSEMELALELGMGEGKSAAALSRDVRKYLVEPNKLFRRVRDKSGALRLSKAAAAYHPGQGVYRSSYKNALRMTATENNMAYRTADHNRWQALPFVIGIEIHISNNHPTEDICDLFDGKRFPKDFKFTGWHPWCRCYAVSVLASQEEMDAYTTALMNGEDVSHWKFTGQVEKMPNEFNKWMKDNQARIEHATSMPYFIKDNFKDGDPTKGLRWEGKTPDQETKPAKTKHDIIMENAAKRHAARTSEQASDIQTRWDESRSNASIVAKAKRTMRITERYPAYSNIKLKRALEKTDYKRLAKVTAEERGYLTEWIGMERKTIEARILINTTNGIDAGTRNYILHEIVTIEKALKAKGRNAYGKAKDGIKNLEKELAAFKPVKTLKKDAKFIERLDAGETAEQLAARLGKDCPATLKNFAKTINQLEADVIGEFSQEEIQVFKDTAREMFRKYDFATNTKAKYLENILDDHLKNLQETGTSGGGTNVQSRINTSHDNFGISKTAKAEEFEKYGLLAEKDVNKRVGGDWYGQTTIRWKKDKVNATFTMDDSLDDYAFIAPSLVTDPKITSIAARNGRNIRCIDLNQFKAIQQASKKGINDMLDEMPGVYYIELQYHGQLTMDCIESVTFAEKSEARVAKKAIKKLLQKGIPCYIQNENAKKADRITEQIFKTL
jgi:hypothetical protein